LSLVSHFLVRPVEEILIILTCASNNSKPTAARARVSGSLLACAGK
jgi:hypothetical protein